MTASSSFSSSCDVCFVYDKLWYRSWGACYCCCHDKPGERRGRRTVQSRVEKRAAAQKSPPHLQCISHWNESHSGSFSTSSKALRTHARRDLNAVSFLLYSLDESGSVFLASFSSLFLSSLLLSLTQLLSRREETDEGVRRRNGSAGEGQEVVLVIIVHRYIHSLSVSLPQKYQRRLSLFLPLTWGQSSLWREALDSWESCVIRTRSRLVICSSLEASLLHLAYRQHIFVYFLLPVVSLPWINCDIPPTSFMYLLVRHQSSSSSSSSKKNNGIITWVFINNWRRNPMKLM